MKDRDIEIEELEQEFTSNPKSDVYIRLAKAYIERGRLIEAIVVLKRGMRNYPDNPEPVRLQAEIYRKQGKYKLELDCLKRLRLLKANSLEDDLRMAEILLYASDFEGATDLCREILEKDPSNHRALTILEEAATNLKEITKQIMMPTRGKSKEASQIEPNRQSEEPDQRETKDQQKSSAKEDMVSEVRSEAKDTETDLEDIALKKKRWPVFVVVFILVIMAGFLYYSSYKKKIKREADKLKKEIDTHLTSLNTNDIDKIKGDIKKVQKLTGETDFTIFAEFKIEFIDSILLKAGLKKEHIDKLNQLVSKLSDKNEKIKKSCMLLLYLLGRDLTKADTIFASINSEDLAKSDVFIADIFAIYKLFRGEYKEAMHYLDISYKKAPDNILTRHLLHIYYTTNLKLDRSVELSRFVLKENNTDKRATLSIVEGLLALYGPSEDVSKYLERLSVVYKKDLSESEQERLRVIQNLVSLRKQESTDPGVLKKDLNPLISGTYPFILQYEAYIESGRYNDALEIEKRLVSFFPSNRLSEQMEAIYDIATGKDSNLLLKSNFDRWVLLSMILKERTLKKEIKKIFNSTVKKIKDRFLNGAIEIFLNKNYNRAYNILSKGANEASGDLELTAYRSLMAIALAKSGKKRKANELLDIINKEFNDWWLVQLANILIKKDAKMEDLLETIPPYGIRAR